MLGHLFPVVSEFAAALAAGVKPATLCYVGLCAVHLAACLGASKRLVYATGAAFYLAMAVVG